MTAAFVHVEFRRSGGLAGIAMVARVDARDLPVEQAQLVTELIGGDSPPAAASAPVGGADRFNYELRLADGDRTRTFNWDETQVPDRLRPLLASLTGKASPAPPS